MQIVDTITAWKKGALIVALISIIGIGIPVIIFIIIYIIMTTLLSALSFNADSMNESSYFLLLAAVITLGPYFIGSTWEHIEDVISPAQKDKSTQ